MRKIFCIVFLLFTLPLFSQTIPKNHIGIFYQEKFIGSMPLEEYEILVKSASIYQDELKAENNKRIKITVKENPYLIKFGETFTADVKIIWINEKQEIFKEMILENSLTLKKENLHEIRILYRDISEIGFPISFLLLFIAIIAL